MRYTKQTEIRRRAKCSVCHFHVESASASAEALKHVRDTGHRVEYTSVNWLEVDE